MKKFFNIILFVLGGSIILGQQTNLNYSDYDPYYPTYFNAIHDASQGNFRSAIPVFERMLAKYPNHLEANLLLKTCQDAVQQKISAKAAQYFFTALNSKYNYEEQKKIVDLFKQVIDIEEHYLPFYLVRADYFKRLNLYEDALSDYSKAIQIQPKLAVCYFSRGKLYQATQMNMLAMSDYNHAIQLNPKYAAVYVNRAQIFAEMHEYIRTLKDFKTAYSIDTTSIKSMEISALLNNLATMYMEQGKMKQALIALNFSVHADDRWHEPFLNRGIVYKALKNYQQALSDLNTSNKLKPNNAETYYNRGLIYKEMEEYEKARDDLIQTLKYKEANPNTYFILAEVFAELKEYQQATNYFKKAIQTEPDNIWAYYQLAGLYDRRRGFEEAVKFYDHFVQHASNEFYKHKIKAKDRSDRIKKYLKQQDNINQQ
jgi:tetratricopeptide (TPR) repeat protein